MDEIIFEKGKIIYGDCLKIMLDMKPKIFDMILTDLPYGHTACKWDIPINLNHLWFNFKRLIKDNGAIVLTATNPFASLLIQTNIDWFKYEWIWHKNMTSGFALAKKQPLRNHELILVFYKHQPTYNPIKELRDLNEKSKERFNYDFTSLKGKNKQQNGIKKVRFIPEDTKMSYPKTVKKFNGVNPHNRLHPTQKPVELFEYLIRTYTNENDIILDCCAGSGTTAIACINTSRKFICVEKEEKYFLVMKERIEKHLKMLKGVFVE